MQIKMLLYVFGHIHHVLVEAVLTLYLAQIRYILQQAFESITQEVVADVHRKEKLARSQSAVIVAQREADKYAKKHGIGLAGNTETVPPIETDGALVKDGKVYLKGNPLETTKNIICPNCKLPRLLYPRVGFNAKDPPDPKQQYCKNEPPIILDKHDVHGQRKKGTKLKNATKNKQKKAEAQSPPSSNPSAPNTPTTSSFQAESFEFKTIDYPAAKCPNRDSAQGDHWKPVTQMATHLNGSCFLKRDRAAGREALTKMSGTPADSRAGSPDPKANGKRGRTVDDEDGSIKKKKQKLDAPKTKKKVTVSPSKLKNGENVGDDREESEDVPAVETTEPVKVKAKPKRMKQEQDDGAGRPTPEPGSKPLTNGVKGTKIKLKAAKTDGKETSKPVPAA